MVGKVLSTFTKIYNCSMLNLSNLQLIINLRSLTALESFSIDMYLPDFLNCKDFKYHCRKVFMTSVIFIGISADSFMDQFF
jgi:hypothetical protein